jgi:predicted nucleic acid-binding protein
LNTEAALHARALSRKARQAGIAVGFAELTVACIASAHGLVVATRNVRDFAPMGIETLDPFAT